MCGDHATRVARFKRFNDNAFYWMGPKGLMRLTHTEIENMSNSATEIAMRGGYDPYHDAYQRIFGKSAESIIIDDPLNDEARKSVKKTYNTVGVRFLEGPNLNKVYTYRVKKGARLHLGQEIVVPTQKAALTNNIAVVVELHRTPQDNGPYDYKFVAGTVKPL